MSHKSALVAIGLLFLLVRFVALGLTEVRNNWNSDRMDQGAYLQLGLNLRSGPLAVERLSDPNAPLLYSSFRERPGFVVDGARQPLYPLMLTTFAERSWDYFTRAKLLNLLIGVVTLIVYFLTLRAQLGLGAAFLATVLLSIDREFIRHSAIVIAEPLLILLFILTWYFTAMGFRRWPYWIAAGVCAGFAFLAKGSAPALLGGFLLTVLIVGGKRVLGEGRWLVFPLALLVVAGPFLLYNTMVFGSPLYNFNYTHAVWLDDAYQVHEAQSGPLPTVNDYLASHSLRQIVDREYLGLLRTKNMLGQALMPLELQDYYDEDYATWALGVLVLLLILFRRRLRAYWAAHKRFLASGVMLFLCLLAPLSWYLPVSPDTRHLLPAIPIVLAVVVEGCRGLIAAFQARLSPVHRTWSNGVLIASGLAVAALLAWSSRESITEATVSPFEVDREKNAYTEAVLSWLADGSYGESIVMYGTSHMLPRWKHTNRLEFLTVPSDVSNWSDLRAYCAARDVDYVIVDYETLSSRYPLLEKHFEKQERQVAVKSMPPDWILTLAHDRMPADFLVFETPRVAAKRVALNRSLADGITLAGYRLQPNTARPGDSVHLTLYWQAHQTPSRDYTVFSHLVDGSGQLRGQVDSQPLHGVLPTSQWRDGLLLADRYDVPIASDAPPGPYQFLVGMYRLDTMERLDVASQDGGSPGKEIVVGGLTVESR